VDAATGGLRWEAPVGLPSAGEWDHFRPAADDGAVYALDGGGRVHALEAATGAARWVHPDARAGGGAVDTGPVVAAGTVYAGAGSGRVYAVDARSGERLWEHVSEADHLSQLAVAGGTVYASFGPTDLLENGDRVEAIEPPVAGPAR
jgi:outer membrane protein assembly factor BamB